MVTSRPWTCEAAGRVPQASGRWRRRTSRGGSSRWAPRPPRGPRRLSGSTRTRSCSRARPGCRAVAGRHHLARQAREVSRRAWRISRRPSSATTGCSADRELGDAAIVPGRGRRAGPTAATAARRAHAGRDRRGARRRRRRVRSLYVDVTTDGRWRPRPRAAERGARRRTGPGGRLRVPHRRRHPRPHRHRRARAGAARRWSAAPPTGVHARRRERGGRCRHGAPA